MLHAASRPPLQAIDLVDEAASRVKLNLDQRPEVGDEKKDKLHLSHMASSAIASLNLDQRP